MKISDLISRLEKLDRSKDIKFFSFIESGMGGNWIEVGECDIEDEDDSYVLKISGSEDEDGGYQ
jgi:hypothetical protein